MKTANPTTCPKGWNLIPICVGETKWATSKPHPSDNAQILSFAVNFVCKGQDAVGSGKLCMLSEYSTKHFYRFKFPKRIRRKGFTIQT